MFVIRAGIHEMIVRIANREDPCQTDSSEPVMALVQFENQYNMAMVVIVIPPPPLSQTLFVVGILFSRCPCVRP